jgi:hypothetical protein
VWDVESPGTGPHIIVEITTRATLTATEARLANESRAVAVLSETLENARQRADAAVAIAEAALGMLDANDPDALWTDEANEIKARLAQIGGEGG